MWRLIIFLLLLIVSVWAGLEIVRHPGYLLVVYQPWIVQMPVWFALLSFLILLGLFYFLITSIDRVGFWWFRVKNWLHLRRKNQSLSKTQQGLCLLIEGRWKKAERLLQASADRSSEPLINYLSAAKAAQEQLAFDRRDQYIKKSYQVAPHAQLAIGLTKAELEIKQHQYEQAIATLTHLRQLSPRHPQVLKMSEYVYARLDDWKQVQLLLPSLYKAKIYSSQEYYAHEKNVYCALFNTSTEKRLSDVRAIWQDMPRYLRKDPEVVCAYVSQLMRHAPVTGAETTKEIEELIRKILKTHWQAELVRIYGKLTLTNLNRQLVIVGAWLKIHGQRPELLLLLGKLCVRVQLWGKAKDYFEKCLAQGANPEASLEYGKLLEQLDEPEEALRRYRDGLANVKVSTWPY